MPFFGSTDAPLSTKNIGAGVASGSASGGRVPSTTAGVLILSASTTRTFASIFNHSTASLLLAYSRTPTVNDFDVKLTSGSYFELPQPVYRGEVYGVWEVANGWAMVAQLGAAS